MVTFILLVRPALMALSGGQPERRRTTAWLDRDYEKSPGRAHAVRCRMELREDGWHAQPAERHGSHILTSMLGADALAIIPAASGTVRAGERVEIELLGDG
jgi:molybdopterin molybdotransferase